MILKYFRHLRPAVTLHGNAIWDLRGICKHHEMSMTMEYVLMAAHDDAWVVSRVEMPRVCAVKFPGFL